MNALNLSLNESKTKIGTLSKKKITEVSKKCGFAQRRSGKIKAFSLILSFMVMMSAGNKSYWDWARTLSSIIGTSVSKQAVSSRMTSEWTATIKELLREVIAIQSRHKVKNKLFCHFPNVWLQNSTSLHLPDILFKRFQGNFSRGLRKAVAKLNVVVNVMNGQCVQMEWMSFKVNEQSLANRSIKGIQAGDLLIRDLGYFVLDCFKHLIKSGIYFLSRLKGPLNIYDARTGKKIELRKLLKGKTRVDRAVLLGTRKDLKVRLVAIKLSDSIANERRRKAKDKMEKDGRLNHSKEYYQLLGYIIFITNVEKDIWNYKQVAEAYRVRWNIEILFKSWKSGFQIQELIPEARTQTERVESILYLMLIYIAWFLMLIYIPLRWAKELKGKRLSLIKTVKFVADNLMNWITMKLDQKERKQIIYYCSYDTRHDRTNAIERLEQFYDY
ncbi:MAG: IS4 family transposase [Bacteroidota bacterium]|nr:IS4 family transposase [Bacteroidota bacterium]